MRPSEFLAIPNSPPLPDSLRDESSIEQYLVNLISHARSVAQKIDEMENDGNRGMVRLYAVRITDFPFLEFSIWIPTGHHYRFENLGLPEIKEKVINSSILDNSVVLDNSITLEN